MLLKQEPVPSSSIPQQHFLPLTFAFGGFISSAALFLLIGLCSFCPPILPLTSYLFLMVCCGLQSVALSLYTSDCGP